MTWASRLKAFLSVLLAALLPTEHIPPFRLEEGPDSDQPHTHEENQGPEEDTSSEEEDLGTGIKTRKSKFSVGVSTAVMLQCLNHNSELLSSRSPKGNADLRIRLSEGFQSSFRNGARFRIEFQKVGRGVSLFLPARVPLEAYRSQDLTPSRKDAKPLPSELPGYRPGQLVLVTSVSDSAAARLVQLTGEKDTACALYEVANSEPSPLKSVIRIATIRVYVAFFSSTGQNIPGLGTTTLAVAFATPTDAEANRFQFEIARNAFSINSCVQTLLFSFVTNRDGYDTTITISNTSLDPLGTSTQSGSVTLYYYGSLPGEEAPNPQTSEGVAAGQQLVFTLSKGGNFGISATPGFQGYIIALTRFQYAYGLAFVNPTGGAGGNCYPAIRLKRE